MRFDDHVSGALARRPGMKCEVRRRGADDQRLLKKTKSDVCLRTDFERAPVAWTIMKAVAAFSGVIEP